MAHDEYRQAGGLPETHRAFLESLTPYFETDRFVFVHGGIRENCDLPIASHPIEELIWSYEISPDWRGKTLVHGHKIVEQPLVAGNHIGLDTGCYKKRQLTTGILDDSTGTLRGYLQAPHDGGAVQAVFL
jgi:serine/threonine protein phosphatase 1